MVVVRWPPLVNFLFPNFCHAPYHLNSYVQLNSCSLLFQQTIHNKPDALVHRTRGRFSVPLARGYYSCRPYPRSRSLTPNTLSCLDENFRKCWDEALVDWDHLRPCQIGPFFESKGLQDVDFLTVISDLRWISKMTERHRFKLNGLEGVIAIEQLICKFGSSKSGENYPIICRVFNSVDECPFLLR